MAQIPQWLAGTRTGRHDGAIRIFSILMSPNVCMSSTVTVSIDYKCRPRGSARIKTEPAVEPMTAIDIDVDDAGSIKSTAKSTCGASDSSRNLVAQVNCER